MFNLTEVEEALKTKTIPDVAKSIGMNIHALIYRLKMAGTDVHEIKREHTRSVLTKLSGKYTYLEMVEITGYSITGVRKYAKLYDIKQG